MKIITTAEEALKLASEGKYDIIPVAGEILSDFIDSDYLNPSTGEPLVYLEDGDLSKTYTLVN